MIKIKVNGKETKINEGITLQNFIKSLELNPELVVCELNFMIPSKDIWESIILNEGDNIEIVKFIGGG